MLLGVAIPYDVYDVTRGDGFVVVGTSHNTPLPSPPTRSTSGGVVSDAACTPRARVAHRCSSSLIPEVPTA
jgi:hypothetical protein